MQQTVWKLVLSRAFLFNPVPYKLASRWLGICSTAAETKVHLSDAATFHNDQEANCSVAGLWMAAAKTCSGSSSDKNRNPIQKLWWEGPASSLSFAQGHQAFSRWFQRQLSQNEQPKNKRQEMEGVSSLSLPSPNPWQAEAVALTLQCRPCQFKYHKAADASSTAAPYTRSAMCPGNCSRSATSTGTSPWL